jgi:uncharacterized protein (DUF2336 family)
LAAVDIANDYDVEESRADALVRLAGSREPSDRRRLLMGIVDLCEASTDQVGAAAEIVNDVFLTLVQQAEQDIRKALSERLADSPWAPAALINVLALDDIEIARPIIARSPLLKDQDLIRVLIEATVEHQIEVARRPRVGAVVVDSILDGGEPAVLTALAGNPTADISETGVRRLVEASRRVAGLRAPLIRHPRMTDELAGQLYTWVGQALRQAISERFRVDSDALDAAIDAAVKAAHAGSPPAPAPVMAVDPQRDEMERRLIAKLDAAGQLRPGYLVRAAREGRISLFENALAVLGGYPVIDVRRATGASDCQLLVLACASVGIDRAAFPSMLSEIRHRSGGLPSSAASDARWLRLFDLDPDSAARTFRKALTASA